MVSLAIRIFVDMKRSEIIIPIEEKSFKELQSEELELVEAARSIARDAYAPYSKFRVGAALRLKSGRIVTGSNQENAAYPSGLCAERTALFYAGAQYPDDPVVALAVTAMRDDNLYVAVAAPCGGCRQVILEIEARYKRPVRILLHGTEGVYVIDTIKDLLPLQFTGDSMQ